MRGCCFLTLAILFVADIAWGCDLCAIYNADAASGSSGKGFSFTVSEQFIERQQALRGCIESLPTSDRQLINLRYQTGMAVQDIAEKKHKSPNAISHLLYRIRTALADCVDRKLRSEPNA